MPPSQPILSSRLPGFVCRFCLIQLQKPQRAPPPWLSRNVRTAAHGAKKSKKVINPAPTVQSKDFEPVIRHFQETPDGRRIEVLQKDPTDEDFKDMIGSIIGNLDQEIEKAAASYGIAREEYEERIGITQPHMEKTLGVTKDINPWEKQDVPDEEEVEEEEEEDGSIQNWAITKKDVQEEILARQFEKNPLAPEVFSGKEMEEEDFRAAMSEDEHLHSAKQEALIRQMESHMNAYPDLENLSEEDRLELRRRLFEDLEKDENEDVRDYPDDIILDPNDPILRNGLEEEESLLNPEDSLSGTEKRFLSRSQKVFEREPDPDEADEIFNKLQHTPEESYQPPILPTVQQREAVSAPAEPLTYTISRNEFPPEFRARISLLNNALSRAYRLLEQGKLGDNIQRDAWRGYILCRKVLLDHSENVPLGVWRLLWDMFERPGPANPGRMEHILRLGEDMRQAGFVLHGRQQSLFIESIFHAGDKNFAFREWQKAAKTLGVEKLTFSRYWKLGIKMYSGSGQPELAIQAFSQFLSRSDNVDDFRLLIPVIHAYLAPETPVGFTKAWAVYRLLKFRLGDSMTMEDYDASSKLFLEANQPDRALQIFVDMMSRAKSIQVTQNEAVERKSLDLADISNIKVSVMHSQTLANLPREFNNKFFFGKWIKKLIGDGDLSGTKRVLDLMRDRGIRADAKHMNGLIGAWYRKGSGRYQTMADEAAWRMIEARTEFVRQRDGDSPLGDGLVHRLGVGKGIMKNDYNSILLIPRATIETFSILIEQYRKRHRKDLLEKLFEAMRVAKVQPSTFFMNEMILTNAKSNQSSTAWEDYIMLTNGHKVHPNFDTFLALWHIEKKATDPVTRSAHNGFATCRELFSEMAKHSKQLIRKGDTMPRELYDSIVLAFGLADDHPGLAVALKALQKRFNILPGEQTARSVVLHLTRAGLRNSVGYRPRRLNLKASTRERIKQVTEVLAAFKKQRAEELLKEGIVFDELDPESKINESLVLMTNLVQYVCQARLEGAEHGPSSAVAMSRIAARNMGVPDCNPWL